MPQKLDHHRLPVRIEVDGCFRADDDSMFFIGRTTNWHVTFVKKDDEIYEELRRIMAFENGILFVKPELEYMYRSEFKSVRSYRTHLRKLEDINNYRHIVALYLARRADEQQHYNDIAPF